MILILGRELHGSSNHPHYVSRSRHSYSIQILDVLLKYPMIENLEYVFIDKKSSWSDLLKMFIITHIPELHYKHHICIIVNLMSMIK